MNESVSSPAQPARSAWQRVIVWSGLAGLVAYLAWPLIPALLLAGIFGVVLHPLIDRLAARGVGRGLSATLIVLGFTFLVLGPTAGLLYWGGQEALDRISVWQKGEVPTLSSIIEWASHNPFLEKIGRWLPNEGGDLKGLLYKGLNVFAKGAGQVLQAALAELPLLAAAALVILFGLYYALAEGDAVPPFVRRVSWFSPEVTSEFMEVVTASCRAGVLATMLTGLAQAAIVGAGCLILGIGDALLLSALTFLLSFVPVLGTGPIAIGLPLFLLFTKGVGSAIAGAIIFGLVVGTVDNIVRPFLARKDVIHPLAGVVLTLGGLFVMGPYGLFLGPVAAGILTGTIRLWSSGRSEIRRVIPATASSVASSPSIVPS